MVTFVIVKSGLGRSDDRAARREVASLIDKVAMYRVTVKIMP